ncbi:hypothetical protein [Agaricicola taiwanensis]|uniref:hypothetical protein n=1 Tax=Agaricicola taiwanensis TaxID=591372 RepID=UPI0016698D06|nr:hypothetical protein [Agaricicola taiwanensis]
MKALLRVTLWHGIAIVMARPSFGMMEWMARAGSGVMLALVASIHEFLFRRGRC